MLITGAVVRMHRPGQRGEGVVRLRVLAGAEVGTSGSRSARRTTASPARAPRRTSGAGARAAGEPGRFPPLTDVGELAPVQVDEAERDRLLKAFQANADAAFFGRPADRTTGNDFERSRSRVVRSHPCVRSVWRRDHSLQSGETVSDVRDHQRDSEREERVVTTGTTAAELFAGERSVIAARVA
ncbi:hypothetical protein GCM10023238_27970 [Streptomyces heliomycini]